MSKCPDCNGPLEAIEWTKTYTRMVCEDRCNGENSHDAHYCVKCDSIIEDEECEECEEASLLDCP